MYVEEFSTGYYFTQVIIEPGENVPQVNHEDYKDLQLELFTNGDNQDTILFQIDQHFLNIEPSLGVPSNVVEIPPAIMEQLTLPEPPAQREVLIPKPWMHEYLKEPDIV